MRRVGRRGGCLLFFAFLDLVYGSSLARPPRGTLSDPTFHYINSIMPLDIWATIWIIAGLLCLVVAFIRLDAIAFATEIFLKIVWGVMTGLAWVTADAPRGYISAAVWLAFAGFIGVLSGWDEPGS